MKLKDWIRAQKIKRAAKKLEKLDLKRDKVAEELRSLDVDESQFTPPPSRFTDEYREFLKQEAKKTENMDVGEES